MSGGKGDFESPPHPMNSRREMIYPCFGLRIFVLDSKVFCSGGSWWLFTSSCNNPAREFGWETAWLLILSPFGWFSHLFLTFTHSPAALIPLSADLLRKTHGKETVFNYHSMVYSIILGLYYSCPGLFSTGNPLFACKTPHRLPEDEFEAIWCQLLSPPYTFSPRSIATFSSHKISLDVRGECGLSQF